MQIFEEKGEGRSGRVWGSERLGEGAGQGQGQGRAGRAQQGTEGRVGLQDSILRFSGPENVKNNIFATLGQGQGLRAGLRHFIAQGRGEAWCRAQGAGAGHKGQSRVARFHFQVFKA